MKLERALITGASAGIGEATAEVLASRGIHLVLLARRMDRLEKVKARLGKKVEVATHALDVRNPAAIEEFVRQQNQPIDILINNAGLAKGADRIQSARLEDWDTMLDTNVKGLLYMTRALLPSMIERGRGHIVNIGSTAGRWVYPGGAVYCASKFAVRALSEGMRMDLVGTPVRVTNIEPGMVETEFSEVRFDNKDKAKAVYKGMKPLSALDVAETIAWCLDRPAHVNVHELVLMPTDQAGIQLVHRR